MYRVPGVSGLHRRDDWLGWRAFGWILVAIAKCYARWLCALGVLLSLWLPIGAVPARAQTNPIINDIQIEGNQRVEADAIRLHISQRTGEPLNRDAVSNDIKSIYQMGFFQNVTADTRYQKGREVLVYRVTERPQITDVKIVGMKAIRSTDDAIVAAMKVHPGSIMDPARVNETKKGIKDAYEAKGYSDARVEYREDLGPDNTEVGIFDVTEGPKTYITEVDFTGNHVFSARELRAQMDTGTHIPLISLITNVGVLDKKSLMRTSIASRPFITITATSTSMSASPTSSALQRASRLWCRSMKVRSTRSAASICRAT